MIASLTGFKSTAGTEYEHSAIDKVLAEEKEKRKVCVELIHLLESYKDGDYR